MTQPVQLAHLSWLEVEAYLTENQGILLPAGSTEQHGPMGLAGTDTICSETVAVAAAELCGGLVAPALAYTPAPFNTGFPGTLSLSGPVFEAMAAEIMAGLFNQGFQRIYVVNGHGANIEPLTRVAAELLPEGAFHLRNWWDFEAVQGLRDRLYGAWEGMHATPSEVAITQHTHRILNPGRATTPPGRLSPEYVAAHSGDRHGSPEEHRRDFPDGRVGSHSALARPEHGMQFLSLAARAVADEFQHFAA